jgi:hypothetical protein
MTIYSFEFMKKRLDRPILQLNLDMPKVDDAIDRCRMLYALRGRVLKAKSIRVRENGGPKIVYSYPERT